MKTTRIIVISILFGLLLNDAVAGDRYNTRGLGMARAVVSSSRGADAIGINPANIAIPDVGRMNLNIMPFSIRVGTELFSYDIYQKHFTGVDSDGKRIAKLLSAEDKDEIRKQMTDFPRTKFEIDIMALGFSFENSVIGGIGFAVIEHAGVQLDLTRDYFDLFYLEGLKPEGSKYVFDGTNFKAWWYREYNLSFGRKLPVKIGFLKDIYAGAAIKFIRGYGIFETVYSKSSLENKPDVVNPEMIKSIVGNVDFLTRRAGVDFFQEGSDVSPTPLPDPVGKGTGFDIGVSGELIDGIRIGASVVDIGKITWDKNINETVGNGAFDINAPTSDIADTLENAFEGKTHHGSSFTTSLPTVMRIGASFESKKVAFLKFLPGRLLFAVEYAQGFNEEFGNTKKARFSIGTEYRIIPFLPLRTGIMLGGGDHVRWAFGTGLDFRYIALELSTDNFGMLFTPKSFNVFSVGFGLKARI